MTTNDQFLQLQHDLGMSRMDISNTFNVHVKTISNWINRKYNCPDWIVEQMQRLRDGREVTYIPERKTYAVKVQAINGVHYQIMSAARVANPCSKCVFHNKDGDYCTKPSVDCSEPRNVYFVEI